MIRRQKLLVKDRIRKSQHSSCKILDIPWQHHLLIHIETMQDHLINQGYRFSNSWAIMQCQTLTQKVKKQKELRWGNVIFQFLLQGDEGRLKMSLTEQFPLGRCSGLRQLCKTKSEGNQQQGGKKYRSKQVTRELAKMYWIETICYPGSGPPLVSSKIWWGFNSFRKLYNKSRPLRLPLLVFTNTSKGQQFWGSLFC